MIASGIIAAVSIATVGALTSLLTGRSPVYSAVRMLLIGTAATLVTFGIGRAVGTTVVA